jgi:hypothetical protein
MAHNDGSFFGADKNTAMKMSDVGLIMKAPFLLITLFYYEYRHFQEMPPMNFQSYRRVIETRPKAKHSTPCAKPRMCIAGRADTKINVRFEFLEG